MTTDERLDALNTTVAGYHATVLDRLGDLKTTVERHDRELYGVPGEDDAPGMKSHVRSLLSSRERFRAGLGLAWAGVLTLLAKTWTK
jgi:hypothetical protein